MAMVARDADLFPLPHRHRIDARETSSLAQTPGAPGGSAVRIVSTVARARVPARRETVVPATLARLDDPSGLGLILEANLFIADRASHRVVGSV